MAKQTLEVMGVEVEFDTDLVNDARLTYLLGALQANNDMEAAKRYAQLCDLVFDDPMDVLGRLSEKHGGMVDDAVFAEFFADLLNKASAKNSQCSQDSSEVIEKSCEQTSSSTTA